MQKTITADTKCVRFTANLVKPLLLTRCRGSASSAAGYHFSFYFCIIQLFWAFFLFINLLLINILLYNLPGFIPFRSLMRVRGVVGVDLRGITAEEGKPNRRMLPPGCYSPETGITLLALQIWISSIC